MCISWPPRVYAANTTRPFTALHAMQNKDCIYNVVFHVVLLRFYYCCPLLMLCFCCLLGSTNTILSRLQLWKNVKEGVYINIWFSKQVSRWDIFSFFLVVHLSIKTRSVWISDSWLKKTCSYAVYWIYYFHK